MDNSPHDPVAQASEFFIEFRVGATPAVRAQFEKWIRASPEHVEAYLEVAAWWSELPIADPEHRIDLQALVAAARKCDNENIVQFRPSQSRTEPSYRYRARTWTIASSLALLLVTLVGAAIFTFVHGRQTYATGISEQRTLILADGSTVTLSALTTVRIRMTKQIRELTLVRGEAYFHDTDEPDRPFIVRAGSSALRALGTQFDVDKDSDRTLVTVLEGRVAVVRSLSQIDSIVRREFLLNLAGPPSKLQVVLVSAGEQVVVRGEGIPRPKPVDVGAATAWMQQRLMFDNTPLETVAQQFNRYSRRRLVVADPSLRNIGISGVYSVSRPAALIGFLRSQPIFHVVETDDEFVITRR